MNLVDQLKEILSKKGTPVKGTITRVENDTYYVATSAGTQIVKSSIANSLVVGDNVSIENGLISAKRKDLSKSKVYVL